MKYLVLAAIFVGEFLFIFFEIFLANKFKDGGTSSEVFKYLLLVVPFAVVFSVLILWGYIYGYRVFEKIWVITIISWSSILIIEPALNYLIFKEVPAGNTLIAGGLAVAAIVISIL
ncbi:MAG: hypothetical protein V1712_03840 [Patescibacteria group bacterium]